MKLPGTAFAALQGSSPKRMKQAEVTPTAIVPTGALGLPLKGRSAPEPINVFSNPASYVARKLVGVYGRPEPTRIRPPTSQPPSSFPVAPRCSLKNGSV